MVRVDVESLTEKPLERPELVQNDKVSNLAKGSDVAWNRNLSDMLLGRS